MDSHQPLGIMTTAGRALFCLCWPCWWESLSLHSPPHLPASSTPTSSPTFGLQAIGIKVHPLLTLSAAHQEPGHSLSWKEGVSLRNLGERGGSLVIWIRGEPLSHPINRAVLALGGRHLALARKGRDLRSKGQMSLILSHGNESVLLQKICFKNLNKIKKAKHLNIT